MGSKGFTSQQGQKIILFSKNFETGCRTHPELSSVVMQLGCEVDHTLPPTAEAENEGSYNSTPSISLYGEHRDKFTSGQYSMTKTGIS